MDWCKGTKFWERKRNENSENKSTVYRVVSQASLKSHRDDL